MANEINIFHNPSTARSSILQIYDKTEESLSEEVQKLKDWMKTQHHLPEMLGKRPHPRLLTLTQIFRRPQRGKFFDFEQISDRKGEKGDRYVLLVPE